MIKLLNKLFFHLKNVILPIDLLATMYIVIFMFKRLDKVVFGPNFFEFMKIVLPFIVLFIIWLLNLLLNHEKIQNNTFYNITSMLVVCTIFIFCYRAIFDKNMLFWHKYGYKINFNYFSDQIAPIKVMLYGLSISNLLLIVNNKIKPDNIIDNNKINSNKKANNKKGSKIYK